MSELKSESLRVRITASEMAELEKLAKLCGDDKAVTARKAIQALLDYAKRHNWRVTFPIEIEKSPISDNKAANPKTKAA